MTYFFKTLIIYFIVSVSSITSAYANNNCPKIMPQLSIKDSTIEKAKLAVVQINSKIKTGEQTGTGFIFGENKLLITNYHVIKEANSISITHHKSNSNHSYPNNDIRIVAIDKMKDLAILKIKSLVYGKKIQPINLQQCSEIVPKKSYPDLLVVANSQNLRNFASKGLIAAKDWISNHVNRPKPEDDKENLYDYKVLLFQNVITEGNSGAPVFNIDTGKVIGIATGVVGDNNHSAFAVQMSEILSFINSAKLEEERPVSDLLDATFAYIPDTDKYYPELKKYSSKSYKNNISISGTVIEKYSQEAISNAIVSLYNVSDENKKRENKLAYSQPTDKDGHFGFVIPKSTDIKWAIDISHGIYEIDPNIKDESRSMSILFDKNDFKFEVIVKRKYSNYASWFYVSPSYIHFDNRNKNEKVWIKNEYSDWNTPKRKPKIGKWSLCNQEQDCVFNHNWLCVNKTGGNITRQGGVLQVKYKECEPKTDTTVDTTHIDKKDLFEDLIIYLEDSQQPVTAPLYVSGNATSKELYLQGFVTLLSGGSPMPHSVTITLNKTISNKDKSNIELSKPIDIDETGYFFLSEEIPDLKNSSIKVKLSLTSGQYKTTNNSVIDINLSDPPSEPIYFTILPRETH